MLKIKLAVSLLLLFVIGVAFAQVQPVSENPTGISEGLQYEIDITKDPALGYVPKSRLVSAYQNRKALVDNINTSRAANAFIWTERGPAGDAVGSSNGNTRPGNGKTSGRVRAIWEDLGDATGKTVWVGGIDGGLWKTNDITVNPATWTPINDFLGNLSVSSICQDPTNTNILYFGTGEKAINADAVRGAGVWISTDRGVTWATMSGTTNFWNVSKMVCDADGNLYVACNSISNNSGLQRYTKSTGTWANITPSGLDARVPDIELSSTGRLHVVCGYYNTSSLSAGYRYTDNPSTVTGSTWTSPVSTFTTQYNVDLASSGSTLYALPANSSWEVPTIYKSTNGGANWAATTTTPSFTSGQSWYNMAVAVDPTNANNVIVGALDCYKTIDGGSSWTKISNWVGTTGQYVHADQQTITWRSNNQVLVGCDGGVHYSANGGSTFSDRNQGLRIKQFYSVAFHPTTTNYFLAGAQDNGVHQLSSAGLGNSVEVTGGDGAFVHIDQNQGQYQWGSYVYSQYRRSTTSGTSWSSVNYSSSAGRFINPTDYDDVNNIMYCSGAANQYVRWSDPQTGATFTPVTMSGLNNGKVSAVKVSPYTSNTVYFAGGGSGITPSIIKATNANSTPTLTSIIGTGMTTGSANISCIELGTDEQNLIVVYSNYGVNNVWVTSNGGSSWTAIDGNLPDMPVRWALFYPGDNTKAVIATETGVWTTTLINGASTIWQPEANFPNVRVDMLQYRTGDGLFAAATHGRGLFTGTLNSGPTCGTVTGLASSAITEITATVTWTALTGALSYDVDYKLNSSSIWVNAVTATTGLSADLSGLISTSLYDYRVRANCDGISGAYATAQFTTATPFVCNAPSGLTNNAITSSGATLNWIAVTGAISYDVDYKLASSGTWINSVTGITGTSSSLAGLDAGSVYDWRVKTNCSGSGSGYSQAQFTTAAAFVCNAPSGLASTGVTSSAATVSWSAVTGALNYDVDYKLSNSGTWINAVTGTTGTSANLGGLTASSVYDWRVKTNCTDGSGSGYSQAQFTTAAPFVCNAPTGLTATSITSSGATVNWTAVTGALNYDVDYKLSSSGTWINSITGTTGTSRNITGLAQSSVYDWRVKTNCTDGSGSGYSQAQFTTAASTACPGIYDVSTNGSMSGAATIPFNTNIYGLINVSGDNDYYKFVITTAGTATITLSSLPSNYSLYLYNSGGSQLANSTNGGNNSESISRTYSTGTYYVRVVGKNGGNYNASSCYILKVQLGTATEQEVVGGAELPEETVTEVDVPEFSVLFFPNPASDKLTVYLVGDNTPKTLTMYDMNGRSVFTQPVSEMFTTLDLQQLARGNYIVSVSQENGKTLYTNKVVLK